MAKGDSNRMRNEINQQKDIAQTGQNQLMNNLWGQQGQNQSNYNMGVGTSMLDYNNIMNQYQNAMSGPAMSTLGSIANDGGINAQAVRARAVSPIRATYANAMRNLNQQRSISGASPNYAAAMAKMTRDLSSNIADKSMEAEGSISDMIARNRLAAASSMGNLGSSYLSGMGNLYGTTPGLISAFGNMLNQGNNNLLQGQGLQNNLSNMLIQGRANNAQIPGNFANAMGNIGGILGLGGKVAGGILGLGSPAIGGSGMANMFGNTSQLTSSPSMFTGGWG